jgi:hypothetical protein
MEKQTRRLLAKSQGGAGVERLFRELCQTALPRTTDKDEMVFPEWKPTLAEDMAREGEAFVQQVLFAEDGKLSTLLTADFTMVNPALATYYGLPAPTGTGFSKVKHKAGERLGFPAWWSRPLAPPARRRAPRRACPTTTASTGPTAGCRGPKAPGGRTPTSRRPTRDGERSRKRRSG